MGGAVDTGVPSPEALGGCAEATTRISSRTADRTDSKMATIDGASVAETTDPVPTPSMAWVDSSPEVLVVETSQRKKMETSNKIRPSGHKLRLTGQQSVSL